MNRLSATFSMLILTTACSAQEQDPFALTEVPALDEYCLAAQKLVTRTEYPMRAVVHDTYGGFVKSKAVIEGPEIHQFHWSDADGNVVGISCKLKSADHLNLAFGDGTAGPDGTCQSMNQAVFELVTPRASKPAYTEVIFEPKELVRNEEEPGMTGPDWLKPYTATWADDDGALHIESRGFQINFTDPQFADVPDRFRGVHYCHFIAPEYFSELMRGAALPGIVIGEEVDTSGYVPPTE